jgi:signal transduction histidine kinase
MPKDACADELARELVAARAKLRRAAQVLHDDVGSLLAVAGLRLQLLRMDHPASDAHAAEVSEALDGVMQHLRTLSRDLEPTPVRRTGLKNALLDLAERHLEQGSLDISLRYTATVALPPVAADAMYQAIESAVEAAAGGRITISISGTRALTARVDYGGVLKNGVRNLAAAGLLAAHAGLNFVVKETKKGTIVSIQYAIQRTSGG